MASEPAPRPGDFLLVHRPGIVSGLIRWGERLRLRSGARWSHAAFVEDTDTVIEALTRGVVRTPISTYADVPHVLVFARLAPVDAEQAVRFAQSCVGREYGWLTVLSIALRFLTPGRGLWFGTSGTSICSGLVAEALCRGWAIFDVEPCAMTPADLADAYGVADRPR